jgi:hypothetical protein
MRNFLKSKKGLVEIAAFAIGILIMMFSNLSGTLEILVFVGMIILGGLVFYGLFLKHKWLAYILESIWIGVVSTGVLYWGMSSNIKTQNLLWQDRLAWSAIMGFFLFLIFLPFEQFIFKAIHLIRKK